MTLAVLAATAVPFGSEAVREDKDFLNINRDIFFDTNNRTGVGHPAILSSSRRRKLRKK